MSALAPASAPSLAQTPVLLHVGLPKCASTWLQQEVFADPATGFAAPWGPITARAVTDFVTADPIAFDADATRASYAAALDASPDPAKRLVVSHEALSSRIGTGSYYAPYVAQRLKATFPRAKLLVLVREQRAIIASIYNETVRQGSTRAIGEFIGTGREPPGWAPACRLPFFEYDRLLGMYREVFGPENVLMLPMEALRADHDAFCARLLAFADLPQVAIPRGTVRNTSIGGFTIALTRRVNRVVQRKPLQRTRRTAFDYARRALRKIDGMAPKTWQTRADARLRAAVAERVGDYFTDSNARLAAMLETDLAQFGYR